MRLTCQINILILSDSKQTFIILGIKSMFHVTRYVLQNMICVVIIYSIPFKNIGDRTMKLMALDEYIQHRYTEKSRPCRRTIIRLLNLGELPGKKIGRNYYVDIEAEKRFTGNPLVDRVING